MSIENPEAVHFKAPDENQMHQSDNLDEHKYSFCWNLADIDKSLS